jgi:hypothetical protein
MPGGDGSDQRRLRRRFRTRRRVCWRRSLRGLTLPSSPVRRRASRRRLTRTLSPTPSATRPAAIPPALARRRPYSSWTADHTRSSISFETSSGRGSGWVRWGQECDLQAFQLRERPAPELRGAGDRRGHDRRAGVERESPGTVVRRAHRVRRLHARAFRKHHHEPAAGQTRAVSIAWASAPPRRIGPLRGGGTASALGL